MEDRGIDTSGQIHLLMHSITERNRNIVPLMTYRVYPTREDFNLVLCEDGDQFIVGYYCVPLGLQITERFQEDEYVKALHAFKGWVRLRTHLSTASEAMALTERDTWLIAGILQIHSHMSKHNLSMVESRLKRAVFRYFERAWPFQVNRETAAHAILWGESILMGSDYLNMVDGFMLDLVTAKLVDYDIKKQTLVLNFKNAYGATDAQESEADNMRRVYIANFRSWHAIRHSGGHHGGAQEDQDGPDGSASGHSGGQASTTGGGPVRGHVHGIDAGTGLRRPEPQEPAALRVPEASPDGGGGVEAMQVTPAEEALKALLHSIERILPSMEEGVRSSMEIIVDETRRKAGLRKPERAHEIIGAFMEEELSNDVQDPALRQSLAVMLLERLNAEGLIVYKRGVE
jgi:hypothetical protein